MNKELKGYRLEVTYQPLNKCWGVLLKEGNIIHNEVDKLLGVALFNMGRYISKLPIK